MVERQAVDSVVAPVAGTENVATGRDRPKLTFIYFAGNDCLKTMSVDGAFRHFAWANGLRCCSGPLLWTFFAVPRRL